MKLKKLIQKQMRKKKRVYIMPTKMGGYLNGLIFLMFLLSVGYSNNLLLIFTLFLFGFNLLWVVQTHFHLQRLKMDQFVTTNAHAGGPFSFQLSWAKSPSPPVKWAVDILSDDEVVKTHIIAENEEFSLGEFQLLKRGLWKWSHLKISTELPFGLYSVWIYFPLKGTQTLAYPRLLSLNQAPQLLGLNNKEGEVSEERPGPLDIRDLAPYQGEELRKISWKHYAKSGDLLIKQGEELNSPLWKHTLNIPHEKELRESYLSETATYMVYCYRHQIPFYFETSTKNFGPAMDEQHLHRCLEVLSLC